ncbi:MAG: hypothetical protein U9N59_00430 [Campylobacterota bacterium]|nr:hypothetical protein [Campylobacterota bacterium]
MKLIRFLKLCLVSVATILFFTGCNSANQNKVSSNNISDNNLNEVILYDGHAIGFAYMKEGKTLIDVKKSYIEPIEGVEVIKITRYGFYPDYKMTTRNETGNDTRDCYFNMKITDKNYKYCSSKYTRRYLFSNGAVLIHSIVGRFGFDYVRGKAFDPQFFEKEYFLKIVKDNNLNEYRKKIISEM